MMRLPTIAPFSRCGLLLILLVFALLPLGCQGEREPRGSLRFVSLAWQAQAIAANKALVARWNADTTNIPVEYVQGTWGSIHDFMITAFETGDVPDVFHYESQSIVDFADRGYLTDLGPLLSDEIREDVIEVAWETSRTEDGAIVGVPFLLESLVVLYNEDLFREAGITPPTSDDPWGWDDLERAAERLTLDEDGDGRPERYGAAFGLRNSASMVMNLSLSFGGGFFEIGPGGKREAVVEVGEAERSLLGTMYSMMHETRTAPLSGVGQSGAAMIPGFTHGDYSMLVGIGAWARQQLVENAPEDFAWAVMPPIRGETQHQGASAQTLSVPSASPYQEEAARFIEYLLASENMTEIARSDWMIPTRRSSMEALLMEPPAYGWATTLAIVDDLVPAPWSGVPGLAEWKSRIANPTFQEVFSGRLSVEDAAERMEDDSRRILGRYR